MINHHWGSGSSANIDALPRILVVTSSRYIASANSLQFIYTISLFPPFKYENNYITIANLIPFRSISFHFSPINAHFLFDIYGERSGNAFTIISPLDGI